MKIFGIGNCSVACHSAILTLALPSLRNLLNEDSCLICPEFSLPELKTFVKFLYSAGNRYIICIFGDTRHTPTFMNGSSVFVPAWRAVRTHWRKSPQWWQLLDRPILRLFQQGRCIIGIEFVDLFLSTISSRTLLLRWSVRQQCQSLHWCDSL